MTAERRRGLALWAATGAAALFGIALVRAVGSDVEAPILCLLRRVAGLPCPGCGLTRATVAFLRGDWGAAWRLHPAAPLLVAEAGVGWLAWGLWAVRGGALAPRLERLAGPLLAQGAGLVALWLGRLATGTLPW